MVVEWNGIIRNGGVEWDRRWLIWRLGNGAADVCVEKGDVMVCVCVCMLARVYNSGREYPTGVQVT
jgi:hypothetical protein